MQLTTNTASVLLRKGSRGNKVQKLQTALKTLNFDPGVIDGIFGSKTEEAVINFQKSQQLVPDGIVGEKTWAKLNAALQEDNPRSNFRGLDIGDFISRNRIRDFDPKAVAIELFNTPDEGEGNRSEEISVAYFATVKAEIIHTILGLTDDSINGMRYRIELERNRRNEWEIIWVGLQTKCQYNRGHQDWSDRLCS
ncbi:MAG: peptidoglycan-binding domain-containing protein [Cyanobacteria bacterium J06643_5]